MVDPIWLLVIMLGVFVVCAMPLRVPTGLSLAAAALAGALVGGAGFPLRHLVEGGFAYIDPILIIATAMVFMGGLEESGALTSISRGLLIGLHRRPLLLVVGMTFFIMFPGMITGQSTATVLTTGAIAAPVLAACGIPRPRVAAMIAMSAIYGMIAPPISLPTMIMGSGVDMPFAGFDLPLAVATFPLAIGVNLGLARALSPGESTSRPSMPQLGENHAARYGLRLFLPLVLVTALLITVRVVPAVSSVSRPRHGLPDRLRLLRGDGQAVQHVPQRPALDPPGASRDGNPGRGRDVHPDHDAAGHPRAARGGDPRPSVGMEVRRRVGVDAALRRGVGLRLGLGPGSALPAVLPWSERDRGGLGPVASSRDSGT